MRLTTRLMQVASWLLVQRAVREGDMPPAAACEDRYRLAEEHVRDTDDGAEDLPAPLLMLLDRAERLYERVRHLDRRMYVESADAPAPANAVLNHLDRLKTAFGA
jgi:regulator of CtrA degradation